MIFIWLQIIENAKLIQRYMIPLSMEEIGIGLQIE